MENWRFDMILLCLKWFCYIEKLIEWQNSRKAYKKQALENCLSCMFIDDATTTFIIKTETDRNLFL